MKILHLSGSPKESMVLWSRIASRFNVPVDFAIAANPGEVKDVMEDYDAVMVRDQSDWDELKRIGAEMSNVYIEDQPIPDGLAARRPNLPTNKQNKK